jgi:hypothetical protein
MKQKELITKVYEKLEETKFIQYVPTKYMQLRLMGLLYDVFMYTQKCSNKDKIYTPEQLLDTIDRTMVFIKKVENNEYTDEKHAVNTIIGCLKRNLQMFYGENTVDLHIIEDCEL